MVRCAVASASSTSARPAAEKSARAAVPDPVKYGTLLAADVSPAIAASSASYAWTSVPIANPRFVRALAAVDAPVPPSATATSVPPDRYRVDVSVMPCTLVVSDSCADTADAAVPAASTPIEERRGSIREREQRTPEARRRQGSDRRQVRIERLIRRQRRLCRDVRADDDTERGAPRQHPRARAANARSSSSTGQRSPSGPNRAADTTPTTTVPRRPCR